MIIYNKYVCFGATRFSSIITFIRLITSIRVCSPKPSAAAPLVATVARNGVPPDVPAMCCPSGAPVFVRPPCALHVPLPSCRNKNLR